MENVLYAEQKMRIVQNLLQIESKEVLNQLQFFIEKFLSDFNQVPKIKIEEDEKKEILENEQEDFEDEFDASKISFEKWNEQFEDDRELDEFLPEYGMTLKEFRLKIYQSEKSPSHPIEKFYEKLESYV